VKEAKLTALVETWPSRSTSYAIKCVTVELELCGVDPDSEAWELQGSRQVSAAVDNPSSGAILQCTHVNFRELYKL
jgi:hypothetical protein